MIVIADTTPLNYLILIDEIGLLPQLFSAVLVPVAVSQELQHRKAPHAVSSWITSPPTWLTVLPVSRRLTLQNSGLHPGELEAMELAFEYHIDTVLMDDARGRHQAQALGLTILGTVAVLENAAMLGLTDLQAAFSKLANTTFRLSPKVRADVLARAGSAR